MSRRYLDGELTSPVEPHAINGFDVETTGPENRFLMGSIVGDGAIGGKEVYWNKRDMLQALLSKRFRDGYIYATNLEFDLLALLDEPTRDALDRWGLDFEMFHNGSQLIYGRIRDKSKHVWEFRDSLNIAPHMGVESMGEIIDLPKLDLPIGEVDAADIDADELEEYNVRDSRITYEFLRWIQNEINQLGGNMEITAAKTALNLFRRKYLKYPIEQPQMDLLEKTYEGYYGGRVSPLIQGYSEGPIYEYDVASLYPYCMSVAELPDTNATRYDRGNGKYSPDEQQERIWEKEGMSRVTVTSPTYGEGDIPVLPVRYNDKLLFPNGTWDGWYTHNELRFAQERGYVVEDVHECIWAERSFNPFDGYVNDLFDKRLQYIEEENESEFVVKLLMNSLYGKFGQKLDGDGGIYTPIGDVDIEELVGQRVVGNWAIESLEDDEDDEQNAPGFINPMLAAYITARGRMELYRWMENAQQRGGNVYYCDTDSIYTDVEIPTDEQKELGEMDYEQEYSDLWVFGPKLYVAQPVDKDEPKITAKGIPFGSMNDMWDALQSGRDSIEYEKLAGMREAFRRDWEPGQVVDQSRSVNVAQESKRAHVGFVTQETMLTEQVETQPFDLNELQRAETMEKAASVEQRRQRDRAQTGFEHMVEDDTAEFDSSLSAAENKAELWRQRQQQMRDDR